MFSFNHGTIASLANLTDQHIVFSHRVLLLEIVLGNYIVLRLVLLVVLLIWNRRLDLLLDASRH
jgi:hypothetical protein